MYRMQNVRSVVLIALVLPLAGGCQESKEEPAERAYRNIQVLKGLPQSQLITTMFFICGSLGVSCSHCHSASGFEKDEKAPKLRAREMMRMVRQLNETQFGGRLAISCNTCHRGRLAPDSSPGFAAIMPAQPQAANAVEQLPTAAQLFARHLQAVGG